jgi:hypothetical protein
MLRLAPSIFPDGKQVVERLRDGTLVRVIIDVIHCVDQNGLDSEIFGVDFSLMGRKEWAKNALGRHSAGGPSRGLKSSR